jgi:hypothetical protein
MWQGDTAPPSIRVLGVRGATLRVGVMDRGSGVDPTALAARIDGEERDVAYSNGVARVSVTGLGRGRHTLVFTAADYQEVKNNENVAGVLPNTRRVQRAFNVP